MNRYLLWASCALSFVLLTWGTNTLSALSLVQTNGEPLDGYTLFAPLQLTSTYLIDLNGQVVHQWNSDYTPGNAVYLLEDGTLLRTGSVSLGINSTFTAGGAGGQVQILSWNSDILWNFQYSSDQHLQHHDATMLPNGNVLFIAWELRTREAAIAAGRDPALLAEGALWPDHLLEVKPMGLGNGQIVWEWHVWDHLIQDFDPAKANYGSVAEHPQRVDLNYVQGRAGADWNHTNSVAYNASLDQILLSVHNFNEIWVIDHGTTTDEAAGSSGGRYGRGGDLLYRWGNPQTYRAGSRADQQLFGQHDAQWIAQGLPGAGNILLFNNGMGRPQGAYSTVEEIVPPLDEQGRYTLASGSAYDPSAPVWTYAAEAPMEFYSQNISGVQRLPNGNTLICSGAQGWFFEITEDKQVVWEFLSPFAGPGRGQRAGSNDVFKVRRYAPDYPGLAGMLAED